MKYGSIIRTAFRNTLEDKLTLLKQAECPQHLECGAQDHWQETIEKDITSYEDICTLMCGDYDNFGTDKVRYEQAVANAKVALKSWLLDVDQAVSDDIYDTEFYFYEEYKQKIANGEDTIT